MSKLPLSKLRDISQSAKEVLDAVAGDHEEIHPENSQGLIELWDSLNDRHAPPRIVKAMADELINLRETKQCLHQQRILDRRRFANAAPDSVLTLIKVKAGSNE